MKNKVLIDIFCEETRTKRSDEVYKGKDLNPPQGVTDISMEASQTVTDTIATIAVFRPLFTLTVAV
jgi:hypothetical protein